jgi:hypothetical protein
MIYYQGATVIIVASFLSLIKMIWVNKVNRNS